VEDTRRKFRGTVVRAVLGGVTRKGAWDLFPELMDILLDEGEGFSSLVWFAILFWLAGHMAGYELSKIPWGIDSLPSWKFALAMISWRFVVVLFRFFDIILDKCREARYVTADDRTLQGVFTVTKWIIIIVALLVIFENFGVNVASVLTGMSIVSLTTAFAAQSLLVEVFCWMMITVKKPFAVDEFVGVDGGSLATVEEIGFTTTRMRSPAGEVKYYSNKHILSSVVENHSRVPSRRRTMNFEVGGLTSANGVEAIPDLVQSAVAKEGHRFKVCWMDAVTDWGYQFVFMYFVDDPDIDVARHADTKIWVNLMRAFDAEGIEMASAARLKRRR